MRQSYDLRTWAGWKTLGRSLVFLAKNRHIAIIKAWFRHEFAFIRFDTRHHRNSQTAQRVAKLERQVLELDDKVRIMGYRINELKNERIPKTEASNVSFTRSQTPQEGETDHE